MSREIYFVTNGSADNCFRLLTDLRVFGTTGLLPTIQAKRLWGLFGTSCSCLDLCPLFLKASGVKGQTPDSRLKGFPPFPCLSVTLPVFFLSHFAAEHLARFSVRHLHDAGGCDGVVLLEDALDLRGGDPVALNVVEKEIEVLSIPH